MVDLRIDNDKLRRRAVAIVMEIGGCSAEAAAAALETTGDSVKLAALVARGATPAEARDLVAAADGNLRKALALLQGAGAAQTRAGGPSVA
jgi:N-acetylmuramic acid 6-phosphate etherase